MITQSPRYSYLNFILFALLALLWSGSFINIKVTVSVLPPVFSAMVRVLVSMLTLWFIFFLRRKPVFTPSTGIWRLWVTGLFMQAIPFALLFYGEKFIAPALAAIINSTVSIWSLVLGTLMFRDFSQWTPAKILGLASGLIGIIVIFTPFVDSHSSSLIGIIAVTGMAIAYAIGGLINQHIIFKKMSVTFEMNLFQQHFSSAIFLLITSLIFESWTKPQMLALFDIKVISAFLYLGVMATALAWTIYFHLIRKWDALRAASVMYIVPMLAIVWDLIFLHLEPSSNDLIGMLTILTGVILIQRVRISRSG